MPDVVSNSISEPIITATILLPDQYLGAVIQLCTDRRGSKESFICERAMIVYDLPLAEVVLSFYDRLKSVTSGYASFDYEFKDYNESDLVKVQIFSKF